MSVPKSVINFQTHNVNPFTGGSPSNAPSDVTSAVTNVINPTTWLSPTSKRLIKADALLMLGLAGMTLGILMVISAHKGTSVNTVIQQGIASTKQGMGIKQHVKDTAKDTAEVGALA